MNSSDKRKTSYLRKVGGVTQMKSRMHQINVMIFTNTLVDYALYVSIRRGYFDQCLVLKLSTRHLGVHQSGSSNAISFVPALDVTGAASSFFFFCLFLGTSLLRSLSAVIALASCAQYMPFHRR